MQDSWRDILAKAGDSPSPDADPADGRSMRDSWRDILARAGNSFSDDAEPAEPRSTPEARQTDIEEELGSAAQSLANMESALRSAAEAHPVLESPLRAIGRMAKAAKRPLRIGIFGELNSGKSSLANLLLGASILPAGPVTNTRLPALLKYSPVPSVTAIYGSGERIAFPVGDNVSQLIASIQEGGANNALPAGSSVPQGTVKWLEIGFPSSTLLSIEILDHPVNYAGPAYRTDAAIWTTVVTEAWRETERDQWARLPEAIRSRGLLAVTFCDLVAGKKNNLTRLQARLDTTAKPHFHGICFVENGDKDPAAGAYKNKVIFSQVRHLAQEFAAGRLAKAMTIARRMTASAIEKAGAASESERAALASLAAAVTGKDAVEEDWVAALKQPLPPGESGKPEGPHPPQEAANPTSAALGARTREAFKQRPRWMIAGGAALVAGIAALAVIQLTGKNPFSNPRAGTSEEIEQSLKSEIEKLRKEAEAEAAATEARGKAEPEAAAAEERKKADVEAAAAEARKKTDAEAAAAEARKKIDAEAAAAGARKKIDAEAAAAEARKKTDAEAAAAEARKKIDAEAAAAEARKKTDAEAAAAEARKKADAEAQAHRVAEAKRQRENGKSEGGTQVAVIEVPKPPVFSLPPPDTRQWRVLVQPSSKGSAVSSLVMPASGLKLVTGTHSGSLRSWELSDSFTAKTPSTSLKELRAEISALAISADGTKLIAATKPDGAISLFDFALSKGQPVQPQNRGKRRVLALSAAPAQFLAVTIADPEHHRACQVERWQADGKEIGALEVAVGDRPVMAAAISPGQSYVAVAPQRQETSMEGEIWVFVPGPPFTHRKLTHGIGTPLAMAFLDERRFAVAGQADKIEIFDLEDGGQKQVLKLPEQDHDHDVTALAFSADGHFLAAAERDGPVHFWDLKAGSEAKPVEGTPQERAGWLSILTQQNNRNVLLLPWNDGSVRWIEIGG